MSQAFIVPDPNFDDTHVTAVDDSGNSVEYAGREARPAVAATTNIGDLSPVPMGYPDAQVSIEAIVRSAGNVGGARVGWKNQSGSLWKGKTAAHIPQDVQFLEFGNNTTTKIMRPKACVLANGDLLVTALYTGGDPTLALAVRAFVVNINGVATPQTVVLGTNPFVGISAVDIVQFPDTNEIVMIVCGYDAFNALRLMRFTSPQPAAGTVPTFQPSAVEHSTLSSFLTTTAHIPTGMAFEVMTSGRLAMLVHYYGTGAAGIARSYSDDRGESWAPFARVGDVEIVDISGTYILGSADIKRTRTGSLLALVGRAMNSGTVQREPSLMPLVSDDGDNWTGLLTFNVNITSTQFNGVNYDWPLGCDGATEGAVAIGDDGIPRFFGCFHGDSAGTFLDGTTAHGVSSYWDDLVQLTLRKVEVTARDKGVMFADQTTHEVGNTQITTSDAFATTVNPNTGAFQVTTGKPEPVTMWRFAVTAGAGTNDLDSGAATFKGPRSIEAINYRGAIWLIVAFEDTANATSALGLIRCNAWSELHERPRDATAFASILYGAVYDLGWMAWKKPDPELTKTGTGVTTQEGQSGQRGTKLDTTGVGATIWRLGLSGVQNKPHFVRAKFKPITGANVANSDVAVRIKVFDDSGPTNMSIVDIRVSLTAITAYDVNLPGSLGSVAGDFTNGVEIVLAFSDYRTAIGLFYKIPTTDPEDAVWLSYAGLTTGVQLAPAAAVGNEEVTFGTFSGNDIMSAWYNVHFTRGVVAASYSAAYLFTGTKAFDAATPVLDDLVVDTIGYDDGLTHGTRAPKSNSEPMYFRKNLLVSWRGAAGSAGDNWTIDGGFSFDVSRVCKLPVRDFWRSASDQVIANLQWDAGASAPGLAVSYVALFGINAYRFSFQMNATNAWGGPSVNLLVDSSVAASRYRHEFKMTAGTITLLNNNYVVKMNAGGTDVLEAGRFRSTAKVQWYVWSEASSKSYRILDNDNYRLIMTDPLTAGDDGNFVVIYPDWIVFPSTLLANGYRFARVHIPVQNTAEGYFKCGYVVAGQAFDLAAPHPNWGWSRRVIPATSKTETEAGFSFVSKIGESRQQFTLGFTGLRGRKDRASALVAPPDQPGYERLISMLERMDWGERVGAFLTQYKDELDCTTASLFGQRSFNVIPARIASPIDLSHQAYEGCHTDALVQAIHDGAQLVVDEVL